MSEPQVLLEQHRGPTEVLRVSLSQFKGRQYADIRVWYTDRDGVVRQGKAGVTLRPEAIPDVLDALQRAMELLDGPA